MVDRLGEKRRKSEVRRLLAPGVVWLLALVVAGVVSALTAKLVDAMW